MWDHSSSLGGRSFSSDKQAAPKTDNPQSCHPDRSEPVSSCMRFLHAGSRNGGIVAPPLRLGAAPDSRRSLFEPCFLIADDPQLITLPKSAQS